jgi:hypothetical protein
MLKVQRRHQVPSLETTIEMAAPQGDDGVGSANRPEHARLLQAATDYGLATSFDHA